MGEDTGVLRRGKDELLVAQLDLMPRRMPRDTAELCILRHGYGDCEWKLKRVCIVYGEGSGEGETLRRSWETDTAVSVGDRFLCWVDYYRGFLLCDMAVGEESLTLRYVPLPVDPQARPTSGALPRRQWKRSFSPASGASTGAVRFVDIESRYCCRGSSECTCGRGGLFLFTVTTWTLSLSVDNEPMAWVKDNVLDCDELWALPAYGDLPRMPVQYPMVSSDDPDAICFVVYSDSRTYLDPKGRRAWTNEVDMRTKLLRSVIPYNPEAKT